MSDLLSSIDARTRLAGTNKLEILLFHLGYDKKTKRRETFGVNVFKVREVMRTPPITAAPEMPEAVEGMVSLRGILVPVVDLSKYAGVDTDAPRDVMIVTEYNGRTQGFLVESVDTILRMDWSQMRVPPEMVTNRMGGLVTAVTDISDNTLVMMLDVEKVLAGTARVEDDISYKDIHTINRQDLCVYFADDSSVARKQIEKTLQLMGVRYVGSVNGRHAWDELEKAAAYAATQGIPTKQVVNIILTDVEMPELDGYILTKRIKSDSRFTGIPVVMHSSLSGMSNKQLGQSVGVDEYVPKFDPVRLSEVLTRILNQTEPPRRVEEAKWKQ